MENVGKNFFELIAVLNLTAGDESRTSQAAGFDGQAELTNAWYRTYRFIVLAGQAIHHTHSAPAVVVQTSAGSGVGEGRRFFGFNGPASWGYFEAGEAHELRNIGTAPIEFVEIEVRQPR